MAEPFLSEIKIFSFTFAPKGYAFCNGQTLPINQNQALFALLGTTYGGNGQTTFQLPDLRGKCAVSVGNNHSLGQTAGEQAHTLSQIEMPAHSHIVNGSSASGNQMSPSQQFWARDNADAQLYNSSADDHMSAAAISPSGGSQPHNNMSPYLTINFCIALLGIFPSRN